MQYTQQEINNNKEFVDLVCPYDYIIQYGDTLKIDFKIECVLTNNQGLRIPINIQPNIENTHPIQMIDGVKTFFRSFTGNIHTYIHTPI